MKAILLALTFAFAAMPPAGSSDLTLRTRTRVGDNGAVDLVTLQMSGARRRTVRQTEVPEGSVVTSITNIVQCDTGRAVTLNDRAKVYFIEPIAPPLTHRAVVPPTTVDTRPVAATRIIDAVDTGERRAFGPLTARHIVTTTTVEREGKAPQIVEVRDGWYADVESTSCAGDDTRYGAVLIGSIGDGRRVDVKWRGTAKTGYPLIERDRTIASRTIERVTELIDVSAAPILPAAFEVPEGYRPALALPGGGADLTQPDTVLNRLAAYWHYTSGWISSIWR